LPLQPFRQIDISVDELFGQELSEGWLTAVMEQALAVAIPPEAIVQVSLLVTDDATVRRLNLEFRGLDETTDVLSFSASHSGHWEGEEEAPQDRLLKPAESDPFSFPWPEDEPPPLGEVVVSLPQARRQAEQSGTPLEREMALLIIHGVLHLAGHDHLEPEETGQMQALEQQALAAVFAADTVGTDKP